MEEVEGYTHSEEWKNRCLVRHALRTKTDDEIKEWLNQLANNRSSGYISQIKKILNEEWLYITDAMKKRKKYHTNLLIK